MQEKRGAKNKRIFLTALWVLLLVISLFFLSFLASLLNSYPQDISSLSWAGYTISKNSNSNFQVTAVSGSWIIPEVNASLGTSFSSTWIGIGGQFDKTLIQVGTDNDVENGRVIYDAWYELLPSFAVRLTDITSSPGDMMTASINLVNSNTDQWNIKISDATTRQAFSENVVYNSTRASGEWIVERPSVNNQISRLAEFGNITFSNCLITVNGASGPITKFAFSKIEMVNDQNTQLTTVSSLIEDGSIFTVSYQASS